MPNLTVLSETPISVYELKKEIERIKKRDGELNYRAIKVEDYLNNSANAPYAKKFDELFEKLAKLELPRIKDIQIKKLIDIGPKNLNDVKIILQGYNISLSNENVQKILDVFKEYI